MLFTRVGDAPFLETWDATFNNKERNAPYRYRLRRLWAEGDKHPLVVIGLNPSTADENELDPTVTRCVNRARKWGHRGLVMLNIFAYRSTDPKGLKLVTDPVGSHNDETLIAETDPTVCGMILCAWGTHADYLDRGANVIKLLKAHKRQLHCLKLTKDGHPGHPLYIKDDQQALNFLGE